MLPGKAGWKDQLVENIEYQMLDWFLFSNTTERPYVYKLFEDKRGSNEIFKLMAFRQIQYLVGLVYERWLLNSRCFYYQQQSCVHYEDRNMDRTQAEWIPRRGVRRQHDFALTLIGLMSHSTTNQTRLMHFLIYPHKIKIFVFIAFVHTGMPWNLNMQLY